MKHLTKSLYGLLALSILLSACLPAPSAKIAKSNERRIDAPNAPSEDIQALVDGNNGFAFDLYRSLRSQPGNLLFSPYSISVALAMTYGGARGDTESEMAETLRYTLPQDRLHPAFDQLDLNLAKPGSSNLKDEQPMQLNITNAVWAEQTFTFLQDYLDLIGHYYGAGIQLADFINNPDIVRNEINNWVSDRTNRKIKDLLPQGVPDKDTRMILVNAIYFKANWLDQFEPGYTHPSPFHLLDGSDITIPMMHQVIHTGYGRGSDYQAVEIPYVGGTAAMDIIVPDSGKFSDFESNIDAEQLDQILNSIQPTLVEFGMPKYEFTNSFELSEQLKMLGMTKAFDAQQADFSGMDGDRDLYISAAIHKAFISVDEAGTEAAAATAITMGVTSAPMPGIALTIDRPFIFVISDLKSGQILFVGRVLNPAE
jgi:serpin B